MFIKNLIKKMYRYKADISKDEMVNIIKSNSDTILLDVRSPQEYEEGHLPRSY